jgi:N-acetylneuraminic acid mutarotase
VTNGIRTTSAALLFLVGLVTLTSAFNFPNRSPDLQSQLASFLAAVKPAQQLTTLTFADRVAYQRAIEEVYWRHRIWPKERPDHKPSLDEVMARQQLEKKVEDYLRNSQALEDYWKQPLSAEQLQAEMDRMAHHTKQPEVLRELFKALGNDPYVIAECLARPALSERLVTNFYAHDQRFHGELKRRAEADLEAHNTVRQMKQTSGKYSEIELLRSESVQGEENRGTETGLKLNSAEWDENVQKLAAMFDDGRHVAAGVSPAKRASVPQVKTGALSPLQEDEERYYATAIVRKSKDRLKLATFEWRKEPLESWRARAENKAPRLVEAVNPNYRLPTISDATSGCTNNTWTATNIAPAYRQSHTSVWTGSEMIVWGGGEGLSPLNTGGRYNPSTDSWTPTSTINAPTGRFYHAAVWTGTEMIVWGGFDGLFHNFSTGGRYNPSTDAWTGTSTLNAPSARRLHTAVWSGNQMIVWGGYDGTNSLNTGGRYNPTTNSWTATSTTNAPSVRMQHTTVWTGGQMIIWGGADNSNTLNTGGRYNPTTNSWTATSATNAPAGRYSHTAVWTGSEMIVWGGLANSGLVNTGGRYNAISDSWVSTSGTSAPTVREHHTAVWTGSEMIIWGGDNMFNTGYLDTGGRYNPTTNSWTATSTVNAPDARSRHTAVWTGTEMIVWGGVANNTEIIGGDNSGGKYNPSTNSWTPTPPPAPREFHTAVWTGSEMIVWGGWDGNNGFNTGSRYNPSTDGWTAISVSNAPTGRFFHTAVWTGSEMIVWGGMSNTGYLSTGGRYNPTTDGWTATSVTNAPTSRHGHTAVWSGTEMIVWGGTNDTAIFNTGGRYNPTTNRWTATSGNNAPSARDSHTAVWTGSEMIVWGGFDGLNVVNTGGRYDPTTNSWTATSSTNAPSARDSHTAVWTGSEMIVWGGSNGDFLNTGGRYNPTTDAWAATTSTGNAPGARYGHTAVWSGIEMIVWGGTNGTLLNTGGRYNPSRNSWIATSTANAPETRVGHTAVWGGTEMIVWGGSDDARPFLPRLNTGGRYCAPSLVAQLGNISTRAFVQTGDNVMIGGFIITGSGQKRLIVRAIGPSLVNSGITNPLQNPTLELHDQMGALIISNDNWTDAPNKQEIINSGLAPTNNLESAILTSLNPGNYTAIVRGVNNGTGVALVEGYDLDPTTTSKFGNISTRSLVETGDNVMIGGFIIVTQATKVIIRAIGPSLAPLGVPDALANPQLELHDTNSLIGQNDDWQTTQIGGIITSDQVAEIRASGLAPTNPAESAIIATLQPGNYTAIVRGVNNTTGNALVEVYDLQQ